MVKENQKNGEKMSYEEFCEMLKKEIPVQVNENISPEQVQIYHAGEEIDIGSEIGQAIIFQANKHNPESPILEGDCLVIDRVESDGIGTVMSSKYLYATYYNKGIMDVWEVLRNAFKTLDSAIKEIDDAGILS